MNTDVAPFTIHIKPVLQQIRLLTGLNTAVKTRNIAIQRVLQQCYKKSCTFFVARFRYPQFYEALVVLVDAASPRNISIDKKKMSSGTRGSEQPSFKRNQGSVLP